MTKISNATPDLEEWFNDQENFYFNQTGNDFNEEQTKVMAEIYSKYAVNGHVDWEDHSIPNSAWYRYMKEIIGVEDATDDMEYGEEYERRHMNDAS